MTMDANGDKGSLEPNQCEQNEDKKVEDGIVGEGQRLFTGNENLMDGRDLAVESQGVLQVSRQQPQGSSVVTWERFLNVGSIKVLLVENDHSTRLIVTALLRNCNYEVMEAANGVQAWKILEDLTNHIDLVLSEVVMPCLSGIGLLCKIMSHKTRKTIPVIMMSSHDSMGLVFKCLSKGAVDFLVKPIRKNELKNLWQHVWRRCHSSSGSGSESGTQTQKSIKSKSSEKSENNSGSNDGEDNESTGLNVGDGSDDGSGTQSSWTKQAVEVDSYQAVHPLDQIAYHPDSSCAQVIVSNPETFGNKWIPLTATRECQEQEQQLDNATKGQELVTDKTRNAALLPENPIGAPIDLMGRGQKTLPEIDCKSSKRIEKALANPCGDCPSNKETIITDMSDPLIRSRKFEAPGEVAKILENNTGIDDYKELPAMELSLKRLRGVKDINEAVQDDRNVFRRSELSAFSRYTTISNAFKPPNGIKGSNSLLGNSLEVVKRESVSDIRSHSNGNTLYPSSNGVSNIIDMGSTTNTLSTNAFIMKDKFEATSTINSLHPSSDFKPMKNDSRPNPEPVLVKVDDVVATPARAPPRDKGVLIQHINHRHHHFRSMERVQTLYNHDDLSLKKFATDAPNCGSSHVLGGPIEGTAGNYTLNRSASGSNHGSNGQNGSSTAINVRGMDVESDTGLAGKSGSCNASGSGSGNRIDQDKYAHREAALNKFRQKRKERCFIKKVRYQNRKKLAEQRPRVRGQFVRQTGQDNSNSAADC